MNWLTFSLGLVTVLLVGEGTTSQPEGERKQDYTSIPGHLEPLGAKGIKHPLQIIQSYPDPKTFFKTYVVASKPVLIQNAARLSSAFAKWTDDYFLSLPESTDFIITAEQRKKEKRTIPSEEITFSEFLKTYKEEDIYLVNSVPYFIRGDVLLPSPLLCRDITEKAGILIDALMWFSSGGTKSVLHLDDEFDNINCLFRGTKELLFIDYYKYNEKVDIDFPGGGYSGVDVDRVDFEKYPGLRDVEFYNVTMQAGDCLFIPQKWFHQVRSYGRNIAVNLWWKHQPGFIPEDCDGVEPNQTLDRFAFKSMEEELKITDQRFISWLRSFLGKNEEISYKTFVKRLKMDLQAFHDERILWPDHMQLSARNLFKLLDVDEDKIFSVADLQELEEENNEFIGPIKDAFYRLDNLVEKELESNDNTQDNMERNDDDFEDRNSDYYIKPIDKDRDEL